MPKVGAGFFAIPGVGPVLVADPLVGRIVAGLEGAVMMGGLRRALQHRYS